MIVPYWGLDLSSPFFIKYMQIQKYNKNVLDFLNNIRKLLRRWGFKCGFVQKAENIWCLNVPVSDASGTYIQFLYSMTWNEFRLEYVNYGRNNNLISICTPGTLDEQIESLLTEDMLYDSPLKVCGLQETLNGEKD